MAKKPTATDAGGQKPGRALRADARRNRARVLQVAAEVFAAEGLSVPVHEIARRAGVGTGTVSRHFPTKEELFAAILLDRLEQLSGRADELAESHDAGTAFFTFFSTLVHEGAPHRGLAEALAGAGYDVETAAADAGYDVSGRLRAMLARAQEAGAVRADITYPDVKALMAGCLSRDVDDSHGAALSRLVAVVCEGLRARPS
ncbi:TetR/AcrR family transcriptional regulator [Planotetraspora phitsanulokensis]|uniref:TetR family transcriptional regulator n=1 Tax=Planotetraspora phitsanulokensis TaxID=575192 RepID=A0A8J3XJX9_9ACTN|nr:TetR/AcrR family transcriptional regulator [Planotetraspora phitsanulokensis]GII38988.1 TetR family transcriptional regulator [Planotetraspora phitsanulokensis]